MSKGGLGGTCRHTCVCPVLGASHGHPPGLAPPLTPSLGMLRVSSPANGAVGARRAKG